MINPTDKKLKASAIMRLKHRVPPEEVAIELNLPLALVEEWSEGLDTKDYASANSQGIANRQVIQLVTAEVVQNETTLEDVKTNIEKAAYKIAKEVCDVSLISFDLERAKTLQLLSGSLASLYNALFNKNQTVNMINNVQNSQDGSMSRFIQKD